MCGLLWLENRKITMKILKYLGRTENENQSDKFFDDFEKWDKV